MLIAYWVAAGLLALLYLYAGGQKMFRGRGQLAESGLAWAADFPAGAVKLIGLVEVLGALGLVLPPLAGIAPVLAPWAGVGLALVQVGAAGTHLVRGESKVLPMNVMLLLVAAATAWIGFVVWA